MKKLCVLVATTVAVAASVAPAEARRNHSPRVVEESYSEPMYWPVPAACAEHRGCVSFYPRSGQRAISISVSDDLGTEPYLYVYQDVDGDGKSDTPDRLAAVCGRTEAPVPIQPGIEVDVFINFENVELCGTEFARKGTVTASFSRH